MVPSPLLTYPSPTNPSLLISYFPFQELLVLLKKERWTKESCSSSSLILQILIEYQVPSPELGSKDLSLQLCVSKDLGREFLSGPDLLGMLSFSSSSIFISNMNTFSLLKILRSPSFYWIKNSPPSKFRSPVLTMLSYITENKSIPSPSDMQLFDFFEIAPVLCLYWTLKCCRMKEPCLPNFLLSHDASTMGKHYLSPPEPHLGSEKGLPAA